MDLNLSYHQQAALRRKKCDSLIWRVFEAAKTELGVNNEDIKQYPDTPIFNPQTASTNESVEQYSLTGTLVASYEEQMFDEAYGKHSRAFHMALLDPTYQIFTSSNGHGSLIYKLEQSTLVVIGDPLCNTEELHMLMEALREFREPKRLKLVFMGVSHSFLPYADEKGWVKFKFGRERVINTLENAVLNQVAGKRMLTQNRHLLDAKRDALRICVYAPSITGTNSQLEQHLGEIYSNWCAVKNQNGCKRIPTFITSYSLFCQQNKTVFLYTTNSHGDANGLTMLRQLGFNAGFHIDPCISSGSAPRGTADLLMITAMKVLKRAEIPYLSLGVEPYLSLEEESNPSAFSSRVAYAAYQRVMSSKSVGGKRAHYDKFYPDPCFESNLYVVFPKKTFGIQEAMAIMGVAHIRPRHIFI